MLLARVELTDEQPRCGPFEQVEYCDGRVDLLRRHAKTHRRHAVVCRFAKRDLDGLAGCSLARFGRRATERDADRLPDSFARLERIGPGQRQRPNIGLERGISPVAVIFHFEGVALHAHDGLQTGHHLVGERAQVQERLHWIDQHWERRCLHHPVGVLDLDRTAGHTLQRVQDDESGARGKEVGGRCGRAGKLEAAVAAAFDARVVGELLAGAVAACTVAHAEAVRALFDDEVAQRRDAGSPVLVAHEKGEPTQHLHAVDPEVAQVAVVQLDRERTRTENTDDAIGLLGAAKLDGAGGASGGHGFTFQEIAWPVGMA